MHKVSPKLTQENLHQTTITVVVGLIIQIQELIINNIGGEL